MQMKRNWPKNMVTAMAAAVTLAAPLANAQATAEKAERCATRLSIAIQGKAAPAALMSSADPQSTVDTMLQSPEFIERFSRFVNATYNDDPGATSADDAAYHTAKYVLTNNRPWEQMFIGTFGATVTGNGANQTLTINPNDANGVGYFRFRNWLVRYAGNEEAGIKISTAYRMMNNVVGLKLVASTNAPNVDISATGRQAAACKACHYDSWFALDKTAAVLSKRVGEGNTMTFTDYTGPQVPLLGNIPVGNDKELVTALTKSEAFKFRSCRLAFEFLYGRPEQTCEHQTFDACMDAFNTTGTIQSAIAVVAKSQNYCQ
jgi:hypothetical protein